jgi:hypothetical protein
MTKMVKVLVVALALVGMTTYGAKESVAALVTFSGRPRGCSSKLRRSCR